jgi:DNA gyrase subunit A
VPQTHFDQAHYCVLATRRGRIKRLALAEFAAVRPSGLVAISLDEGDAMGWARLTGGQDELVLITAGGKALRYAEDEVRPMGRTAGGVTAIRLQGEDSVASMEVVEPGGALLVVSSRGYGKRTPLSEYPAKGRGTGGVTTTHPEAAGKIGPVAVARVVQEEDELTLMAASGVVLRTRVKDIPSQGRAARGVRLMELAAGDRLVSLARTSAADLRKAGD